WLIRGTAVYGGGSVLDVPVAVAGDSFYYLPTHEINSGCALIAYRTTPDAPPPKKTALPGPQLTAEEWRRVQELPWDWDTLNTPRLKNVLEALPGTVPGTVAAPLTAEAERRVGAITDGDLDEFIWKSALASDQPSADSPPRDGESRREVEELGAAVRELISQTWRPLVFPAAKAPDESYRFFNDPSETCYTLLLARAFLDRELQRQTDAFITTLLAPRLRRTYEPQTGESRVPYDVPLKEMRVIDDIVRDDLARVYPLWLWSRTTPGADFVEKHWKELRPLLHTAPAKIDDDCGNSRLAGLIAYCRLAKIAGDKSALDEALPVTRQAMRARLIYEFAHTRGGVIRAVPNGRAVLARWRRLTPDVARLLAAYARPIQEHLMASYVDYQRPGWWIVWNVEQLMRNEAAYQLL